MEQFDEAHQSLIHPPLSLSLSLPIPLFPIVDQDQDPPHRHHRREFRFDLSRIPEGEVVTAAEFRIYKDFLRERYENETFRVGVFRVLQDPPNGYR
ncbi:Bone morphogenetic protein 7 [Liparis tanakae]|uniref:Bone morphogenetic protein 7 n=1 Tax=Liparis tanakae TaxID=230148 RepID=A0A4Z2EGD9_9TELE|nr:Bone morphogenetic protein 7 [Liparis tanakae]